MNKHICFFLTLLWIAFPLHSQAQKTLDEVKEMYAMGQLSQAEGVIDQLIEQDARNSELRYWKGLIALKGEAYEEAKASFLAGIKLHYKYSYNHLGLARVFFHENKKGLAAESLQKALELEGANDFDLQLAVADAYLKGKMYPEGKVLLYQLQSDIPDDPRPYIALGDYYWMTKTNQHAMIQYEQAIRLAPDYVPAYVRLGQLLIEEKQYDAGAEKLNKAIALNPNYAEAYRYMGELYAKAQNFEAAKNNYKKYLTLTQNDVKAREQYGAFLFMCKDYEGLVNEYKVLDERAYSSSRMFRLMGYAYYELNQPDKAKSYLDQFFGRADPDFIILKDYEYYGKILLALEEYDQADTYFSKVVEMDATKAKLYDELAKGFKVEKQYALEARYRQLFLNHIEPNSRIYQNLGIAYYHAQNYEAAGQAFEHAQSLSPEEARVYIWQARVYEKVSPEDEEGKTLSASQKVVELLGNKLSETGALSKWEMRQMTNYCMFLAHALYHPNEDGLGDCEAAKPYVDRLISLSQTYTEIGKMENFEYIKALSDYCNQ